MKLSCERFKVCGWSYTYNKDNIFTLKIFSLIDTILKSKCTVMSNFSRIYLSFLQKTQSGNNFTLIKF